MRNAASGPQQKPMKVNSVGPWHSERAWEAEQNSNIDSTKPNKTLSLLSFPFLFSSLLLSFSWTLSTARVSRGRRVSVW
ncbi:MAG: hypothetical protein CL912_29725 [Deltaproteobacteria bacterium]|nr:hypothetical protein [Deltaproteobacteria bacterium]